MSSRKTRTSFTTILLVIAILITTLMPVYASAATVVILNGAELGSPFYTNMVCYTVTGKINAYSSSNLTNYIGRAWECDTMTIIGTGKNPKGEAYACCLCPWSGWSSPRTIYVRLTDLGVDEKYFKDVRTIPDVKTATRNITTYKHRDGTYAGYIEKGDVYYELTSNLYSKTLVIYPINQTVNGRSCKWKMAWI